MGKALLGTYATPRAIELLDEVRALRRRVSELEDALARAEAAAHASASVDAGRETVDEPARISA